MSYEKLLHRQITHVERRLNGWMKLSGSETDEAKCIH